VYFERLQQVAGEAAPLYVVIEKILANHEKLPREWLVSGTTGYDFAALAIAWLHEAAGELALDRIYHSFLQRMPVRPAAHPIAPVEKESGDPADFSDIASQARRLVMNSVLAAEVSLLAWQADRIAQADRHTADFTRDALRAALVEVLAHFPVYRTYRSERGLSADDERYIEWAIRVARRRSQLADPSVFDFLHELLTGTEDVELAPDVRAQRIEFALKFQQVSAPVMAKGIEDTALYIYDRQIALNDVGSDPRLFSVSTGALHKANEVRANDWPASMLATSTHDSKRSEDVRARLAVLSELPGPWSKAVARWRHLHRSRRRVVDEMPAPSRNDEYYLYQTILGAWPLAGSAAVDATFVDRIVEHMLKIIREAKVRTSWMNPNPDYEAAVEEFTRRLFERPRRNAFIREMNRMHDAYGYFGLLNSLSLMTLKVCSPGVADFYQGTELPALTLVDPDNRRPVNYSARVDILARESNPAELLGEWRDGQVKLHLIRELLEWRRSDPDLFVRGSYVPLQVEGEASEHVCAFARVLEERALVTVVPRCFAKLSRGVVQTPALMPWADTRVALPAGLELEGAEGPAEPYIYMSRAMTRFPLTTWWARNREPSSRVRESRAAANAAVETEASIE
jgi:(1->4)-alpha-D-glucan 1-alpha-D-glucosylmutase